MVESCIVTAPKTDLPAPPVGVIASLTTGFEAVNQRLGLVLFPLALDLLLWLGPHLSIYPIAQSALRYFVAPPSADAATRQAVDAVREMMTIAGERFNLLSLLSTAPMGIPSLMARIAPVAAPTGSPAVVTVGSPLQYLALFLAFNLLGLLLGALYLAQVAQVAREPPLSPAQLLWRVWSYWAQFVALAAVALLGLFLLSLPIALVEVLLLFISPFIASIAPLLGVMAAAWLLFYLVFVVHGVLVSDRNLLQAIYESVGLVTWNTLGTYGLFFFIIVISLGLGYIWTLPKPDSWMALVGIAGHAYISTALVAATFVFYKDRRRWWLEMRTALARRQAELAKQHGPNR